MVELINNDKETKPSTLTPKERELFAPFTDAIPDLLEYHNTGKIAIIPLNIPGTWNKTLEDWNKGKEGGYQWDKRKYTASQLAHKLRNGVTSLGVRIAEGHQENGASLHNIDVDGYTLDPKEYSPEVVEGVKQQTKKDLFKILKEIPGTLQVETQSGGFHLYAFGRTQGVDSKTTSRSLHFPPGYTVTVEGVTVELGGKSLGDALEVFTQHNRQCVLPGSKVAREWVDDKTIKDKQRQEVKTWGYYKVISNLNKLSEVDTVQDINLIVRETLEASGYTYKETTETKEKTSTNIHKTQPTANTFKAFKDNITKKELNDKQAKQVANYLTVKYDLFALEGIRSNKDDATIKLGAFFSTYLTQDSILLIGNEINKRIGDRFKSQSNFINHLTGQEADNKGREDLAGLPKLLEMITETGFNKKEFENGLRQLCDSRHKRETLATYKDNGQTVEVILQQTPKTKQIIVTPVVAGCSMLLNFSNKRGVIKHNGNKQTLHLFSFTFRDNYFNISNNEKSEINKNLPGGTKLTGINVSRIRNILNDLPPEALEPTEYQQQSYLRYLFDSQKNKDYRRKELGGYLASRGVVLHYMTGEPYLLNPQLNCYELTNINDLLTQLNNSGDFTPNSIATQDLKSALDFISYRLKPTPHIIKFNNTLYNMKEFKPLEAQDAPVLPVRTILQNYNPSAGHITLKAGEKFANRLEQFLFEALREKEGDGWEDEAKTWERVNNLYEYFGYTFVDGNPLKVWVVLSGLKDAGKGLTSRLWDALFGLSKISGITLQELDKSNNKFAGSQLLGKSINIIRDSPLTPVNDTGTLKQMTGGDPVEVEPKGKQIQTIEPEFVPHLVYVGNKLPPFKYGLDSANASRILFFHFGNSTAPEDIDPELLNKITTPECLEFLIIKSLEAYKKVAEGKPFGARAPVEEVMKLVGKHTDPIGYFLTELVEYDETNTAPMLYSQAVTSDGLSLALIKFIEGKGITVDHTDKNGRINGHYLRRKITEELGLPKDLESDRLVLDGAPKKQNTVYLRLKPTDTYLKVLGIEPQ